MTLKDIYKSQLEYVKAIAEDVKRNDCSEEVIAHASKYAQVENEFGFFVRVNFGEVYAYIMLDGNDKPTNEDVCYNMDEARCYEQRYTHLVDEINRKTEEEFAEVDFAWCYDDVISKGEYHLEYKPFKK